MLGLWFDCNQIVTQVLNRVSAVLGVYYRMEYYTVQRLSVTHIGIIIGLVSAEGS